MVHSRPCLVKPLVILREPIGTPIPRPRRTPSILRRALRHAVSVGLLACATPSLHAQTAAPQQTTPPAEPTPATTIAVNARLVAVPVVARDKKGALVPNLTQADFALEVDGKPQPIRYFDKDANLPLTLGLLVDTSGSVSSSLDEERTASTAFLDGMLTTDKDRAFIMQFAHQAELLQDLTNSKPKLQAALKELDTDSPDRSQSSNDPNDPDSNGSNGGGRRRAGGGTLLYDAAFLAGDELMKKQTGRKALILLTDGEDRGSRESLASAPSRPTSAPTPSSTRFTSRARTTAAAGITAAASPAAVAVAAVAAVAASASPVVAAAAIPAVAAADEVAAGATAAAARPRPAKTARKSSNA